MREILMEQIKLISRKSFEAKGIDSERDIAALSQAMAALAAIVVTIDHNDHNKEEEHA